MGVLLWFDCRRVGSATTGARTGQRRINNQSQNPHLQKRARGAPNFIFTFNVWAARPVQRVVGVGGGAIDGPRELASRRTASLISPSGSAFKFLHGATF